MSEGPVSFGKPLFFLVVIGVAAAGTYAYLNWPAHYDGPGWNIDFPRKWVVQNATDSDVPKITASGPLPEERTGYAWATINVHGTIHFPAYVAARIPAADWTEEHDIDYKKGMLFTFNDGDNRMMGVAVDRVDAVIICAIGCPKPYFEANRALFDKVCRSIRCQR